MNLELMKAHVDAYTYDDINPKLKKDNSNVNQFFCADVVGNRRFVTNFGGYPRSEIAQINAAADLTQQMNLLQQLEDYSPASNPNAGLSDTDIMLGHRSKYCQTASEQVAWLEGRIHDRDMKRVAAEHESSHDKIDFSDNEDNES